MSNKQTMVPIETILAEVANGEMYSIDRKIFATFNRLLNERGYHCTIVAPVERDVLIEITKNALTTGQRTDG